MLCKIAIVIEPMPQFLIKQLLTIQGTGYLAPGPTLFFRNLVDHELAFTHEPFVPNVYSLWVQSGPKSVLGYYFLIISKIN